MRKILCYLLLSAMSLSAIAEMYTFTLWESKEAKAEPLYLYDNNGDPAVMCRTESGGMRGIVLRAISEDDKAYIKSLNLETREK